MHQYNVLVTGARSGIGRAFVRAFLEGPRNHIIAIDRDFPPGRLNHRDQGRLLAEYCEEGTSGERLSKVLFERVDVTNEVEINEFFISLPPIDLLIHSAGVRGLVPEIPIVQSSDVARAETLDVMTAETMQQTFNINTIGTFLLLRGIMPKLRAAKNAKVVIMGSRMGSIGHNMSGGGYAYRASKAALNAIVKSFSVDVPDVVFSVVNPGRVESNLVGGVVEDGAITAEESARDMLQLIPKLDSGYSGQLMDRWGKSIHW